MCSCGRTTTCWWSTWWWRSCCSPPWAYRWDTGYRIWNTEYRVQSTEYRSRAHCYPAHSPMVLAPQGRVTESAHRLYLSLTDSVWGLYCSSPFIPTSQFTNVWPQVGHLVILVARYRADCSNHITCFFLWFSEIIQRPKLCVWLSWSSYLALCSLLVWSFTALSPIYLSGFLYCCQKIILTCSFNLTMYAMVLSAN